MNKKQKTARVEILLREDGLLPVKVWSDVRESDYQFGTSGPLVEFEDVFRVYEFYRRPDAVAHIRRPIRHYDVILVCARSSSISEAYVIVPNEQKVLKSIMKSVHPMPFTFMKDSAGSITDALIYRHIVTSGFKSRLVP